MGPVELVGVLMVALVFLIPALALYAIIRLAVTHAMKRKER